MVLTGLRPRTSFSRVLATCGWPSILSHQPLSKFSQVRIVGHRTAEVRASETYPRTLDDPAKARQRPLSVSVWAMCFDSDTGPFGRNAILCTAHAPRVQGVLSACCPGQQANNGTRYSDSEPAAIGSDDLSAAVQSAAAQQIYTYCASGNDETTLWYT
ncbi:hypothetical protein BC628DRAFT_1136285 [Trametes gibbosa]|nr:hypothetical protein BC628DRAFT_1136285 [Trametes gibbosa]